MRHAEAGRPPVAQESRQRRAFCGSGGACGGHGGFQGACTELFERRWIGWL
jgi:hypothetical protein